MVDSPSSVPKGFTNGLALEASRGRLPGLTNGLNGRTNGLATGKGQTNGLGRGIGRTNGLDRRTGRPDGRAHPVGLTNGLSLRSNSLGIVAPSDVRRTVGLIAGSLVLMLVFAYLLGVPASPRSPFSVDGDFSEWKDVPLYTYDSGGSQASGDLVGYALHAEPGRLFVYGKTVGALFSGTETSVVFVEIDNPTRAGYAVPGFDADYIAEFWGSNNSLRDDRLWQWSGAPDRDNASALWTIGNFPAAVVGNQFEMALSDYRVDFTSINGLRLRIVSEFADQDDSGAILKALPGALVVTQASRSAVVSSTSALLELRMRALLGSVNVTNVVVKQSGGGTLVLPPLPMTILSGQEAVVQIGLNVSSLPVGAFVTYEVSSVTATAFSDGHAVPVTINGDGVRTYVKARPPGHHVDGVFDDWSNTTPDPVDPVRPSIDLRATAFAADTDPYFYVRTGAAIMTGTIIPEQRIPLRSAPNATSPPTVPLRRAGEDILQIFVESGTEPGVGPIVGGIHADRFVEFRGRAGRITAQVAYAWNDTTWTWNQRTDPILVAFVGPELEASIASSFFTPTNNSRAVFAMTDWSGAQDRTDVPVPKTAPSLTTSSLITPLHALIPDNITATPLVNTPTVDGICGTTAGEYAGASIASNAFLTFAIGSRDDTQDIYVCLRVTADITRSNNDWAELIFDTLHNGGTAPQTDDKLFWVFGNGDNVLKAWQGNGVGWGVTCPACDPGNVGKSRWSGSIEVYEFRIKYADVWNTSKPAAGQVAGFAIVSSDFNTGLLYTWGGNAVDENVPDSWGHVMYSIPEFASTVPAIAGVVVIVLLTRRATRGRTAGRRDHPRPTAGAPPRARTLSGVDLKPAEINSASRTEQLGGIESDNRE